MKLRIELPAGVAKSRQRSKEGVSTLGLLTRFVRRADGERLTGQDWGSQVGRASASAVDIGAQDERLTDDGRQGLHLWPREDDVGRHLGEVGVRAVHGGHRVSSGSSGRREG